MAVSCLPCLFWRTHGQYPDGATDIGEAPVLYEFSVQVVTTSSRQWLSGKGFAACAEASVTCFPGARRALELTIMPRVAKFTSLGWVTARGGAVIHVPMTLVGERKPVDLDPFMRRARWRADVKGFFA